MFALNEFYGITELPTLKLNMPHNHILSVNQEMYNMQTEQTRGDTIVIKRKEID